MNGSLVCSKKSGLGAGDPTGKSTQTLCFQTLRWWEREARKSQWRRDSEVGVKCSVVGKDRVEEPTVGKKSRLCGEERSGALERDEGIQTEVWRRKVKAHWVSKVREECQVEGTAHAEALEKDEVQVGGDERVRRWHEVRDKCSPDAQTLQQNELATPILSYFDYQIDPLLLTGLGEETIGLIKVKTLIEHALWASNS